MNQTTELSPAHKLYLHAFGILLEGILGASPHWLPPSSTARKARKEERPQETNAAKLIKPDALELPKPIIVLPRSVGRGNQWMQKQSRVRA